MNSKLMIGISGIRGIFGETLLPEDVIRIAAHFGNFSGSGKIIVGRDSRTTGQAMFNAVSSGLISVGCDVIDLGIVSTPTVLLKVEESDAIGGISITASHNPAPWNAMKFIGQEGMFLFPEKAAEFIKLLKNPVEYTSWGEIGSIQSDNMATREHINKILNIPYLNISAIKAKKYKVVIDSVNGAGGLISPLVLKELGCEVIELNSEPTGIFAHEPEPLNKNLTQLEEAVIKHQADIGFATDPDVDRLAIVANNGLALGEEYSLLLAEKYVLDKIKGDIVTNLSSSMASDDIAAEYGVKVHRTRVGEINVGKLMKEIGSPIGGEGNGGIICPEIHYTRDAPAGMALILGFMAESDKTILDLAALIPKYYFAKDKIVTNPEKLNKLMEKTEIVFADSQIDRTDGIKIIGTDHWIHIRKSGTEPIIRIYVESRSQERSQKLCRETIEKLLN